MKTEKLITVEVYIKSFPNDKQKLLQAIRKALQEVAPDAVESISNQMPN